MAARLASCAACLRTAVNSARIGRTLLPRSQRRFLPVASYPSILYATRQASTATSPAVADAPQILEDQTEPGVAEKKEKERLQRIVKRELKHMDDPFHIAKQVQGILARNDVEHALLLTQQASKDKSVVVAWNHIITHLFQNNQFKRAIKTYNEMKKRGQLPNMQTYTAIFDGCAKSSHAKLAVSEAFKHYNILLQDRRLEPNSIHLNSLIHVCARAGDMDAMFLVAKSINDTTRAADAQTYTTIINGLRHHVINTRRNLDGDERSDEVVQTNIRRGQRIWVEVLDKWDKGKMRIDEELVCAMGRLLLNAPPRTRQRTLAEVFELLQQTMNIPNFAAGSGSQSSSDASQKNVARSGMYVKPGRNTLALILTAAAYTKSTPRTSLKYWNHLVQDHGVQPDEDNWVRMLRVLKVSKSSADAASVIDLVGPQFTAASLYRIAMETCVRDNINPNVMKNATKVLDAMAAKLVVPDLQTMRLYLRVALVSHFQLRAKAQGGEEEAAKREYGTQIMDALEKLWEPYKAAHSHFFKGTDGKGKVSSGGAKVKGETYNGQREVISLARQMYSAVNKVINENMVPPKQMRLVKQFGGIINREIQLFFSNREDNEPKLRSYKGKKTQNDKQQDKHDDAHDDAFDEITVPETDGSSLRQGGDFVWNTSKAAREKAKAQSQEQRWR